MVNRCTNCGGLLVYDIATGKLKCEFCDSLFNPAEYKAQTEATEEQDPASMDVNIFTCPNCGGQVSSTEADAVEYCMYCGSFVTLQSQLSKIKTPDYIIPFKKTKEECKEAYGKMIRKKLYAPKEFKDPSFLEGFKGIYIPFWSYEYSFGPNVHLQGEKETRNGDYVSTQHYDIDVKAEGEVTGVDFDASSHFDDELSGKIVPYTTGSIEPFNSAYMFGFYGDTADVNKSAYQGDADDMARGMIWDDVSNDPKVADGSPVKPDGKEFDKAFSIKKKARLSMMPVWFLTWRKNDRVAYSVMNGETGELFSEVPIDFKKYLLVSLLCAIPIFFIMNMLFTVNASNMLFLSLTLSLLMLILYSFELDSIVKRTLHSEDKGYLSKHKDAAKEANKVSTNFLSSALSFLGDMLKAGKFIGIVVAFFVIVGFGSQFLFVLIILAVFVPIYTMYRIGKDSHLLHDGTVWLDILGSLLALVISILMLIADPAGDVFYYFAAIICMIAIGITASCAMRRYNQLATRPLPHFFNRKAGGES